MLINNKRKRKIKILLVIYGDIHFGGVSVLLNNLLSHMDKEYFEFTLYAFGKVVDKEVLRRYQDNGVNVVLGGHDKFRRKKIAMDLLKIMFMRKFDIVHCNTGGLDLTFVTLLVAKACCVKCRIAHSHSKRYTPGPYSQYEIKLQNKVRMLSTVQLACSEEASLHMFGNTNAQIISNGIDANKFSFREEIRRSARMQMGLGKKLVIGTVGRLDEIKNQSFIFEIAKRLKQHVELAILIVGSGALKDKLVEYSSTSGLSDETIFVEANENVEYYLAAMDVFLLPSFAEGLGISAIEAQAMDLPVWCSTGVPRFAAITEKAFFMDLDDGADSWSESIYKYCKEIDLDNRGDRGADVREKGYDILTSAQRLFKLYYQRRV